MSAKIRKATPAATKDTWGDLGEEANIYSTASLPASGHDSAIDDDQQVVRNAASVLEDAARTVAAAGDNVIARRLSVVSRQVLAKIGIQEKTPSHNPNHSTAPLNEPAEDGKAIDDDEEGGKLEFYHSDLPPDKDQVLLPRRRSSSKVANPCPLPEYKDRVKNLVENLDEGVYEKKEQEFHNLIQQLNTLAEKKEEGGEKKGNVEYAGKRRAKRSPDQSGKQDSPRNPGFQIKVRGDGTYIVVNKATGKEMDGPFKEKDKAIEVKRDLEFAHDRTRSGSKKASKIIKLASPWQALKQTLKRVARKGGAWGTGHWETSTEDYGNVLDLKIDTHQDTGEPIVASTVTFSLLREDPKARTAAIEVNDGVIENEVREITLDPDQAVRYASKWAEETEKAAKTYLYSY